MIWFLMLLVAAGAICALIWNYQRKIADREAASKQRFEEMFLARQASAPPPAVSPGVTPKTAAAASEVKAAIAIAAAPKGRFLGQPQTLIYRLLKVAIPDHEIFANVALASVIGGKSEQEARRLSQYQLDLVVCDKGMQVVAVVDMESAGGMQAAGEQRLKTDSLKAAGIRVVHIDVARLPRRDEIRALICGQSGSPASVVKE